MKTVLLTNGQQRKTLAAARSLGKRGIKVIIAEETIFNPSAFSKYCRKFLRCPNPQKDPDKYYEWLYESIKKYGCDVLFPMDDDVLNVVMKHREELLKICKITLPPADSYELACDKGLSTKMVDKAGVPCPKTIYPVDLKDALLLSESLKYPLIVKPRKSAGSRGIRIVSKRDELKEIYDKVSKEYPEPIIQEFMGIGDRYSVCLFYDNEHELKAYFTQKHLRRYPVEMGPSVVQKSIEYPELLEMGIKAMENIRWTGVVEMDFMVDPRDNILKFLEINPRFWGCLQMAIYAGVDFPWLLYKLGIEGSVESITKYETGLMCRWLLPGDIMHFISNNKRKNMDPPFLAGKRHNVRDDIISAEDPLPVLGFVFACFRYLLDIRMWRVFIIR